MKGVFLKIEEYFTLFRCQSGRNLTRNIYSRLHTLVIAGWIFLQLTEILTWLEIGWGMHFLPFCVTRITHKHQSVCDHSGPNTEPQGEPSSHMELMTQGGSSTLSHSQVQQEQKNILNSKLIVHGAIFLKNVWRNHCLTPVRATCSIM